MRPFRPLSSVLLLALVGVAGCTDFGDPPPPCSTAPCQYERKVREGDDALREFQGDRAVAVYMDALAIAENPRNRENDLDTCRPVYGAMLGHMQSFIAVFNKAIESVVNVASGAGAFAPAADLYGIDIGEFIANYYTANFEEPSRESRCSRGASSPTRR